MGASAGVRAAARSAAAATSAVNNRRSLPCSGCHCTPSTNPEKPSSSDGPASTASIGAVFLPGDRLEARRRAGHGLMVVGGHVEVALIGQDPGQHAARADPHLVPSVAGLAGRCAGRGRPGRARAGAACRPGRRSATCMPRQMASSGTPCASALPVTARSHASRTVTGACVRGCRAAPYRTGSMSGPPDTTRPSRPATVALASCVVPARRQQDRPSAAAPHRVHVRHREASPPGLSSCARTLRSSYVVMPMTGVIVPL